MTLVRVALIAAFATLLCGLPAPRRRAARHRAPATPTPRPMPTSRVLTPEERAEREARKACKIKICDILATKDPQGDDVACDIVKTWREEDITKMLGGRIDWPWGKAVCQSKLEMKREQLAKAMTRARITRWSADAKSELHARPERQGRALCGRDRRSRPRSKFENGKAVEARSIGARPTRRCSFMP